MKAGQRKGVARMPRYQRTFLVHNTISFALILLVGGANAHAQSSCRDLLTTPRNAKSGKVAHAYKAPNGKIVNQHSRRHHIRRTQTTYRLNHGIFEGRGQYSNSKQIAFDYRAPETPKTDVERPVFLLIHGVGDSREDLNGLTKALEQRSERILRVDTLGHGQTAKLPANQSNSEEPIDYRSDVELIVDLLRTLGLKKVVIIGHSKGGGLAMDITQELKDTQVEVVACVPIAPYLSAVDKWFLTHALAGDPELFPSGTKEVVKVWIEQRKKIIDQATSFLGPGGRMLTLAYGRFQNFWRTAMSVRNEMNLMAVDLAMNSYIAGLASELSDPFVKVLMHQMYTKYLNIKNEKLPPAKRKSGAEIELLVKGAIAATIGIRDLDFQNRNNSAPLDDKVPTLIITGSMDQVVMPAQVKGLMESLERRGYTNIEFLEVDSDHFFPQKHPEEVIRVVMAFLSRL